MAQLLFLLAYFEHDNVNVEIPKWFAYLKSKGISQSWLSSLQASTVCNFSRYCPRVGIFVDFLENQKDGQPQVKWYTSLNVPVWYPWTDRHQKAVRERPQLAYLQPPAELLQAAATIIIRAPTAILPSALLPSALLPSTSTSAVAYPQLWEHPPSQICDDEQQSHGTHEGLAASDVSRATFQAIRNAYIATKPWLKFFNTRDALNKKKFANESTEQRQTCLNRKRKPPIRKVDVFLWDWSDEDPHQLVRTRVTR
ncbi:hypothetical protein BYT27DRAFT_7247266 [Phlegmacium glaucopus]|nr:hypothetical protein BYT27DRAFT_7247266 [Phlegmacium glaucopus]